MNILLINNYDSFVYNLYHLIKTAAPQAVISIVNNNDITIEQAVRYDYIIISPGPGVPAESGAILAIIQALAPTLPILGVCLGHQAIAQAFGATLYCTEQPKHGIKSQIHIRQHRPLFKGLPEMINVGRYHSWLVAQENLPDCLSVTAVDESGHIMALSHKHYPVHGVQFHPESIMTPLGKEILANFLWQ